MRSLLIVSLFIASVLCGQERNCSYANYLAYNRANVNNYGVRLVYGEGVVDAEVTGFAFETLEFTASPTLGSICAFDYSEEDFNGWEVEYLDDEFCAMKLTRQFTNDDYFSSCSEPVDDDECPGCAEYLTTIDIATDSLFTGSLPSGEPEYVVILKTDTDILLVPTEVTAQVTVNVVAPEEYGFLLTATISVIPGTSTLGLTYKGEINYPYSVSRQISPPTVIPEDQVNAAVLPLWVHDGDHTWSQIVGQIFSEPEVDCQCDGIFTVSYQVFCLNEELCDLELMHQNEIIYATYDVFYDGCPEHLIDGSATLMLGVEDIETKEPVSVIIAEKPYDLVSYLVYNGPKPIAPMICTYSFQQVLYDGTEGEKYDNIEIDPRFNPEFQLQTETNNTLRFTLPTEFVNDNGDIFVISEECDLPRPFTKEAAATATKGKFAFSLKTQDPNTESDGKDNTVIYAVVGACAGAVALVAIIAGVVAFAMWKKTKGYSRI